VSILPTITTIGGIVSDKFSGGSGDWAKGVAGVRYSFEVELRDKGQRGFVLPTSYIQPVGEEAWSAIGVLATHIVSDENDNTATTTATTTTDILDSSRTMIAADSSRTDSRLTCLYSSCAVILLSTIIVVVVVVTIVIIVIIVIVHKKTHVATTEQDRQDLVSTYL